MTYSTWKQYTFSSFQHLTIRTFFCCLMHCTVHVAVEIWHSMSGHKTPVWHLPYICSTNMHKTLFLKGQAKIIEWYSRDEIKSTLTLYGWIFNWIMVGLGPTVSEWKKRVSMQIFFFFSSLSIITPESHWNLPIFQPNSKPIRVLIIR